MSPAPLPPPKNGFPLPIGLSVFGLFVCQPCVPDPGAAPGPDPTPGVTPPDRNGLPWPIGLVVPGEYGLSPGPGAGSLPFRKGFAGFHWYGPEADGAPGTPVPGEDAPGVPGTAPVTLLTFGEG